MSEQLANLRALNVRRLTRELKLSRTGRTLGDIAEAQADLATLKAMLVDEKFKTPARLLDSQTQKTYAEELRVISLSIRDIQGYLQ
jgi:hypothetical protein